MSSDSQSPTVVAEIHVGLIQSAKHALDVLTERTGLSDTDLVNRALIAHANYYVAIDMGLTPIYADARTGENFTVVFE